MGALGLTLIVGVGLGIGFGVKYLSNPRSHLEWFFVAVATGIGAFLGSEALTNTPFGIFADGPQIDGLVIIPAIITGLTLGLITDAYVRYVARPDFA